MLAVVLALDRYRQLGHGFDGRRLVLRGGSLLRRWSELDPAGVVAYELRSSPGQRRAGLCTLVVHLGQGAGSRRALDAGEDQAAALLAGLHPRLLEPLLTGDGVIDALYLERGEPVTVLVRWGGAGPRNVLIERADGARVVRPFRGLRRVDQVERASSSMAAE